MSDPFGRLSSHGDQGGIPSTRTTCFRSSLARSSRIVSPSAVNARSSASVMSRAASSSLRWLSCADSRGEPLDSLYRSATWRPHDAKRSPTSFHASFVPDIAIPSVDPGAGLSV